MILGLDPGLATLGWAIVRPTTGRVVDLGVILQPATPELDESTDRAQRAAHQATVLGQLVTQWKVTTIAAEAMSFGGPPNARFAMAISLGLSWGVIAGLARSLRVELHEVTPKQWQHAVAGHGGKVDYAHLFTALAAFTVGQVESQLMSITKANRNHALDAVGIGVFTALRTGGRRIR